MRELISPEQSQFVVLIASIALSVLGTAWGFWAKKAPGLIVVLVGPLVFGLWLLHGALTARFGLDSLALLVGEAIVFIALGAILGKVWNRIGVRNKQEN